MLLDHPVRHHKTYFAIIFKEQYPINKRLDVGFSDQELVMQSTKALNKMIKKRGITKDRAKQIKQERRTLKNRGRYNK